LGLGRDGLGICAFLFVVLEFARLAPNFVA
jgi:hypothetical protein